MTSFLLMVRIQYPLRPETTSVLRGSSSRRTTRRLSSYRSAGNDIRPLSIPRSRKQHPSSLCTPNQPILACCARLVWFGPPGLTPGGSFRPTIGAAVPPLGVGCCRLGVPSAVSPFWAVPDWPLAFVGCWGRLADGISSTDDILFLRKASSKTNSMTVRKVCKRIGTGKNTP